MFLQTFLLFLPNNSHFMLTLASLKTTIISNTPAKPMMFVFTNITLKLCGFSFFSAPLSISPPLLNLLNAFCFNNYFKMKESA